MIRIWRVNASSFSFPFSASQECFAVQVLACVRRAARDRIVLLAREDLIEPDRAVGERDRRARQVEEPGAIRPLAGQRARFLVPLAEALDPVPAGARVVEPKPLDVEDLEAGPLDLGQGLAEPGQIAVRKDVAIEELGLAGRLPVKLV